MTVSYQGGGIYNVYFANKMIVLSEAEVVAIQDHDFFMPQDNRNIGTRQELEKEVESSAEIIRGLQGLVTELSEVNLKLENMLL